MISSTRKLQLTRVMQFVLVGIFALGVYRMSIGIMVNAGISLLVTFLPGVLERDYSIAMNPGIVLWIVSAVFLHAVGALGPYRTVWWWDHVTHFLSAGIVAGVGYAALRSFDEHYEEIRFPRRFVFVFLLLFVMAFGVIWEVLEFGAGGLAALTGQSVLTQYGLEDTMKDLVFDSVGAVVVAVWGEIYLSGVIQDLRARLEPF